MKHKHLDEVDSRLSAVGTLMHLLKSVECQGCALDVLLQAVSALATGLGIPEAADAKIMERLQELIDEDRAIHKEFAPFIDKIMGDKDELKNPSSDCSKKLH